MKFCPTCQTKYDEEVIRFCIKDGTPLVDGEKPEFKEIPSEVSDDDDLGEKTVIRRNKPPTPIPPPVSSETEKLDPENVSNDVSPQPEEMREDTDSKRIVISTEDEEPNEQAIRPKENIVPSAERHERKKSSAALVALLSIVGTLVILAGLAGVFWFLSSQEDSLANENLNANIDLNENQDANFDANDLLNNINANENANSNENANFDFNITNSTKTPTPTPTKTPTPTPTKTPTPKANTNTNVNANTGNTNVKSPTPIKSPTKTPSPKPTATPKKTPTPSTNTNKPVNVGQINGRAVRLPSPQYTSAARAARASGRVTVRVLVDEKGNVVSATATSGHPLLRRSAVQAARRSKFRPVSRNGRPVRATGTIAYNFVN